MQHQLVANGKEIEYNSDKIIKSNFLIMKIWITLFFISLLSVKGQELKKITKKHEPCHCNKEEYYVLANQKKVKQGSYKMFADGIVIEEGFYNNNKKDSTWTSYSPNYIILSTGTYKNDLRIGNWKFYTNTGELEQEYNYTTKKVHFFKPNPKEISYKVIAGKDTTYELLDRPPLVIGGQDNHLEVIVKNIRYPIEAMKKNIADKIYVRFTIDEEGKTSDFSTIKKGDKSLDAEAIRVVKLIDNWLPALKGNQPVKVINTIPITFSGSSIISR